MEKPSRGEPQSGVPGTPRPAQVFDVRVAGTVPDSVLQQLSHVEIISEELRTSLRGRFRDQAELHGFLATLRALGLDVVEIRRLAGAGGSDEEGDGQP